MLANERFSVVAGFEEATPESDEDLSAIIRRIERAANARRVLRPAA
jgi:hypothetical protein